MRPVVLIAGLVLSAASAASAQPVAAKPACQKPATLIDALSGLFGRSSCRATGPEAGTPGAGQAIGQRSGRGAEPAQQAEHAAPARLATTTCREALPSYDAAGQATYLPLRACGRY